MRKVDYKNKLCVYLDQFVISDIIESVNPYWIEIKKLIEESYYSGKIYCPLSPEHILETVRKDFESAKIHNNYLKSISDGYILKSEPFLTSQLISSLIRKNKKTLNTFLVKSDFKNIEDFYEDINKHHDIFSNGIKSEFLNVNTFRKVVTNKLDKKTENLFIETIKQKEVNTFKERLQEYLILKSIRIRPDNFGNSQIPNWIDQLLYQLTNKHSFKEKELKLLLAELEKNGFSRIPTLNTKFSIGAYIAVKGKQENSGDQIDIMRISSYLFSSDIFLLTRKGNMKFAN